MPPVNTQGSRAGLLTTLIVSIVLLLVSLIMWIYANSQWTKADTALKDLQKRYESVVSTSAMTEGGSVQELNAVKDKIQGELQGTTAVDVAMAQIRHLTRDINKESTSYMDSDQAAADAIKRAKAALAQGSTTQPSAAPAGASSLVAMLDVMTKAYNEEVKSNASKEATLGSMTGNLEKRVTDWDKAFATLQKSLTSEHKRAEKAVATTQSLENEYDKKVAAASASFNAVAARAGGQVTMLQKQVTDLANKNATDENKLKEMALQIVRYDVKNAAVRQPDGKIVRVPSSNVCYIDLGQGDHLPVGITFEVYDKNEGIPGLGTEPTTNNNLPVGKASLEVVRVGENSSECRIIHMTPGATLSEGDLIANLIYDRNQKLKFVVYGKFDVDGNNVWTTEEAEVVKSLVTRWGGTVQDHLTPETDFVVIGKEPEIPLLTKEQKEDPILARKYEEAQKDAKDYNELINRATELHLPVMNQNRFMYYIGYYDQMKR